MWQCGCALHRRSTAAGCTAAVWRCAEHGSSSLLLVAGRYGQEWRLHPRQADWILAKVRRNECIADRRRCVGPHRTASAARFQISCHALAHMGRPPCCPVPFPCLELRPCCNSGLFSSPLPSPACSSSCGFDLFLTQDFGASWTNLTANSNGRISSFRDYDWGCKMDMCAPLLCYATKLLGFAAATCKLQLLLPASR